MKFRMTKDWLMRHLAEEDDSQVAAGGTTLEELRLDAQRRRVTPAVIAEAPTQIGKVVRFRREQRGLTRSELARMADVDENEIEAIESREGYVIAPRTVVYLAQALGFARDRLQELAGHMIPRTGSTARMTERFAAYTTHVDATGDADYETICALVEALSEKPPDR